MNLQQEQEQVDLMQEINLISEELVLEDLVEQVVSEALEVWEV